MVSISGQEIVKKHKGNSENLLKNMVCKRLTYNCSNGILQVKESYHRFTKIGTL